MNYSLLFILTHHDSYLILLSLMCVSHFIILLQYINIVANVNKRRLDLCSQPWRYCMIPQKVLVQLNSCTCIVFCGFHTSVALIMWLKNMTAIFVYLFMLQAFPLASVGTSAARTHTANGVWSARNTATNANASRACMATHWRHARVSLLHLIQNDGWALDCLGTINCSSF